MDGMTPVFAGSEFRNARPGLLAGLSTLLLVSAMAQDARLCEAQTPWTASIGARQAATVRAAASEEGELVDEIVRLRTRRSSPVREALESILPGENHAELFRAEVAELARETAVQQAGGAATFNLNDQPGTAPWPTIPAAGQTLLQPQLQPQPLVAFPNGQHWEQIAFAPAPLQPQPMPLPMARVPSPSMQLAGANPPSPATARLRQIARQLESAAADMEDLGLFDQADRLRNQCQELRQLGRQPAR